MTKKTTYKIIFMQLGEIYEEGPYYKPSPTNIMREIDRAEKKKIKKG